MLHYDILVLLVRDCQVGGRIITEWQIPVYAISIRSSSGRTVSNITGCSLKGAPFFATMKASVSTSVGRKFPILNDVGSQEVPESIKT